MTYYLKRSWRKQNIVIFFNCWSLEEFHSRNWDGERICYRIMTGNNRKSQLLKDFFLLNTFHFNCIMFWLHYSILCISKTAMVQWHDMWPWPTLKHTHTHTLAHFRLDSRNSGYVAMEPLRLFMLIWSINLLFLFQPCLPVCFSGWKSSNQELQSY